MTIKTFSIDDIDWQKYDPDHVRAMCLGAMTGATLGAADHAELLDKDALILRLVQIAERSAEIRNITDTMQRNFANSEPIDNHNYRLKEETKSKNCQLSPTERNKIREFLLDNAKSDPMFDDHEGMRHKLIQSIIVNHPLQQEVTK